MAGGLKEELSCPICLEVYQDPVMLPCQHNFCRECLSIIVQQHHTEIFLCPSCRCKTPLTEKQVTNLPKNFALANIISKLQVLEDEGSESRTGHQPEKKTEICLTHKRNLSVYCNACDAVLCTKCLSNHSGHDTMDLEDKVSLCKSKVRQSVLPQISSLIDYMNKFHRNQTACQKDFEKDIDQELKNVTKTFSQVRSVLDHHESKLVSILQSRKEEWCMYSDEALQKGKRWQRIAEQLEKRVFAFLNLEPGLETSQIFEQYKQLQEDSEAAEQDFGEYESFSCNPEFMCKWKILLVKHMDNLLEVSNSLEMMSNSLDKLKITSVLDEREEKEKEEMERKEEKRHAYEVRLAKLDEKENKRKAREHEIEEEMKRQEEERSSQSFRKDERPAWRLGGSCGGVGWQEREKQKMESWEKESSPVKQAEDETWRGERAERPWKGSHGGDVLGEGARSGSSGGGLKGGDSEGGRWGSGGGKFDGGYSCWSRGGDSEGGRRGAGDSKSRGGSRGGDSESIPKHKPAVSCPDKKTQQKIIKKMLRKPLEEKSEVFIVSKIWITKWKAFLSRKEGDGIHPGPVNNASIMGTEDKLNDNLLEEEDFVSIDEPYWTQIVEWFGLMNGQKPIKRKVISQGLLSKSLTIEIYPMEVVLNCRNRRESRCYSQSETLQFLKNEFRKIFKIPVRKDLQLKINVGSSSKCSWMDISNQADDTCLKDAGISQGTEILCPCW